MERPRLRGTRYRFAERYQGSAPARSHFSVDMVVCRKIRDGSWSLWLDDDGGCRPNVHNPQKKTVSAVVCS